MIAYVDFGRDQARVENVKDVFSFIKDKTDDSGELNWMLNDNDDVDRYFNQPVIKKVSEKVHKKAAETVTKQAKNTLKQVPKAIVEKTLDAAGDFVWSGKVVSETANTIDSVKKAYKSSSKLAEDARKAKKRIDEILKKSANRQEKYKFSKVFKDAELLDKIHEYVNETIALINTGTEVRKDVHDVIVGVTRGASYLAGLKTGYNVDPVGILQTFAPAPVSNFFQEGGNYDGRSPIKTWMDENQYIILVRGIVALMQDSQEALKNGYDRLRFQSLLEKDKAKFAELEGQEKVGMAINKFGEMVLSMHKLFGGKENKNKFMVIGDNGFVVKKFRNSDILISLNKILKTLMEEKNLTFPLDETKKQLTVYTDKNKNDDKWYVVDNDNKVRMVYNGREFVNEEVDKPIRQLRPLEEYSSKEINERINFYLKNIEKVNEKMYGGTLRTSEKFGVINLLDEIGDFLLPAIRTGNGKKLSVLPYKVLIKEAMEIDPEFKPEFVDEYIQEAVLKNYTEGDLKKLRSEAGPINLKKLEQLIEFAEKLNKELPEYTSTLSNDIGVVPAGGAIVSASLPFKGIRKGFNQVGKAVWDMLGSNAAFNAVAAAGVLLGLGLKTSLKLTGFLLKKVFRFGTTPEIRDMNEIFNVLQKYPKKKQLEIIGKVLDKYSNLPTKEQIEKTKEEIKDLEMKGGITLEADYDYYNEENKEKSNGEVLKSESTLEGTIDDFSDEGFNLKNYFGQKNPEDSKEKSDMAMGNVSVETGKGKFYNLLGVAAKKEYDSILKREKEREKDGYKKYSESQLRNFRKKCSDPDKIEAYSALLGDRGYSISGGPTEPVEEKYPKSQDIDLDADTVLREEFGEDITKLFDSDVKENKSSAKKGISVLMDEEGEVTEVKDVLDPIVIEQIDKKPATKKRGRSQTVTKDKEVKKRGRSQTIADIKFNNIKIKKSLRPSFRPSFLTPGCLFFNFFSQKTTIIR